ncbi:MAG: CBS domain-containing protein [Actinomycetia bacterium]|nr:CBS domain-containing protein [Actinomycetes bacterium]MCP4087844.1 CBS domain-containing protein [Actinomycetes bacterium]
MTKVSGIMTTSPTTIDRADPVSDAFRALSRAPYHHLIVTDGGRPVGMVSSTDLLRLVHDVDGFDQESMYDYLDQQYTIDDAMTPELRTVSHTAAVRDAAVVLAEGAFHSVVVVDDYGNLAGIVTTTDLARYVADGA